VIVFDLKCGAGHVFEAWFGSSAAYAEQQAGGLVECPLCGSREIGKAVMAPNIPAKGNSQPPAAAAPANAPSPELVKAAMAELAQVQSKMLEGSQWVGGTFSDRARAMHNGDETPAPIHGQATVKQAKELHDDGVAIAPLPFPVIPPNAQN
jgi:hypothetical protein